MSPRVSLLFGAWPRIWPWPPPLRVAVEPVQALCAANRARLRALAAARGRGSRAEREEPLEERVGLRRGVSSLVETIASLEVIAPDDRSETAGPP